jgi:signal transduction histidine kinase
VPFTDDAGNTEQYVAVRYDITERKLAEEKAIRYANKHAMDMEELRDSKAQILQQDRLAPLGLLASSLAHEIGTPMGIIRSRAELAQRRSEGNTVLKQDMQIVISQIDRITKLVNSLLNLARTRHSENISEVDISAVVSDVLNLVQHELDRKSIQLNTKMKNTPLVKAEAGPLGQVLLNLLVNAIHAIEDSKQKSRTQEHQIKLHIEEKEKSVIISVQDTGSGISEENMSQVFKPFFTTKDVGQGSGLGLATSYKIITSWGGSIGVQSQFGAGTTFTVHLLKVLKK